MRFDDDVFDFGGFGQQSQEPAPAPEVDERTADAVEAKRAHRRTKECTELSQRYEYRRAFSEVRLLEAMKYVPLQDGCTYNFITAGDVDSLSFLKVVLNQHDLDYMLCSTWCMAAEDILQIQQWWEAGRIKRFDMYMGEIFPGSYKIEWSMVRKFYEQHPDVGRAAIFKNHSKIYAGCNERERGFISASRQVPTLTPIRAPNKAALPLTKGFLSFTKSILTA